MQKTLIDRISGRGGYRLTDKSSISDLDLRSKENTRKASRAKRHGDFWCENFEKQ